MAVNSAWCVLAVLGLLAGSASAALEVTSPAAGQSFFHTQKVTIVWRDAPGTEVRLSLFRPNPANASLYQRVTLFPSQEPALDEMVPNDSFEQGTYEWTVPTIEVGQYAIGLAIGPEFNIVANVSKDELAFSGVFDITDDVPSPYIEAPGAGEIFYPGSQQVIKWGAFVIPTHVTMEIRLSNTPNDPEAALSTFTLLHSGTLTTDPPLPVDASRGNLTITWPVNLQQFWNRAMRVRIIGADSDGNEDLGSGTKTSENIFTPGITLPSFGAVTTTFAKTLTWTSGNFPGQIYIVLYKYVSSAFDSVAHVEAVNNTGSATVRFPATLTPSGGSITYRGRLLSANYPSSIVSTIYTVAVSNAITVTNPVQNFVADASGTLSITFTKSGFSDPVDISLTTGYGLAEYQAVVGGSLQYDTLPVLSITTGLTGTSFSWSIPAAVLNSTLYAIVVSRTSDSLIYATSTLYFTIQRPDPCLGVSCSNGGVCGAAGECSCPEGFYGDTCQFDSTAVIGGFVRTANSYVLLYPNESSLSTTHSGVTSADECAERCIADPTCGSFEFGHAWTQFANTCYTSPFTAATAGVRLAPTLTFSFFERRECSDPECLSCSSGDAGSCLRCSDSFFLEDGGCVSQCSAGWQASSLVVPLACEPCGTTQFKAAPGAGPCTEQTTCAGVGVEFEVRAPNATADRVCDNVTTCVEGEFVVADPTTTSDRECDACAAGSSAGSTNQPTCDPCVGDTFQDETGQASCKANTQCGQGQFQQTGPTAASDRTCANCTAGSFTNATNLEQCFSCPADTYQDETGQASCKLVTVCTQGQFEDAAPTGTSDRGCDSCAAGTFSNTTNQAQCHGCPAGSYQNELGQSSCKTVSNCAEGSVVVESPTTATDRTCGLCGAGTFSDSLNQNTCESCTSGTNYQNELGQTSCKSVLSCSVGEERATAPNTTFAGTCKACDTGFYQDEAGQLTCKTASTCNAGQEVDAASTASTNTVCRACQSNEYQDENGQNECKPASDCQLGQEVDVAHTVLTDTTCKTCDAGHYQDEVGKAPCKASTTPGVYVDIPPVAETPCPAGKYCPGDGLSYDVDNCTFSTQFEAAPPSSSSNRDCRNITLTCPANFLATPPTTTSDRLCVDPCNPSPCLTSQQCQYFANTAGFKCEDKTQGSTSDSSATWIIPLAVALGILFCCLLLLLGFCWRRRRQRKQPVNTSQIFTQYNSPLFVDPAQMEQEKMEEMGLDRKSSFYRAIAALPDKERRKTLELLEETEDVGNLSRSSKRLSKRTREDLDTFKPTLIADPEYEAISEFGLERVNPAYEGLGQQEPTYQEIKGIPRGEGDYLMLSDQDRPDSGYVTVQAYGEGVYGSVDTGFFIKTSASARSRLSKRTKMYKPRGPAHDDTYMQVRTQPIAMYSPDDGYITVFNRGDGSLIDPKNAYIFVRVSDNARKFIGRGESIFRPKKLGAGGHYADLDGVDDMYMRVDTEPLYARRLEDQEGDGGYMRVITRPGDEGIYYDLDTGDTYMRVRTQGQQLAEYESVKEGVYQMYSFDPEDRTLHEASPGDWYLRVAAPDTPQRLQLNPTYSEGRPKTYVVPKRKDGSPIYEAVAPRRNAPSQRNKYTGYGNKYDGYGELPGQSADEPMYDDLPGGHGLHDSYMQLAQTSSLYAEPPVRSDDETYMRIGSDFSALYADPAFRTDGHDTYMTPAASSGLYADPAVRTDGHDTYMTPAPTSGLYADPAVRTDGHDTYMTPAPTSGRRGCTHDEPDYLEALHPAPDYPIPERELDFSPTPQSDRPAVFTNPTYRSPSSLDEDAV